MYKFSPYIEKNVSFLQKLASTKSDRKKNKILLSATTDQILAIVEICANILKFNFILTLAQKKKLSKYADFYRSIAKSKTEKSALTTLQKGSGVAVGALLYPVLSALTTAVINRLQK